MRKHQAMEDRTRLVWLDLEMTGLNPEQCVIIEIGIIITGPDLKPIAQWEQALWHSEETLARMEPFVRQMHTKNGLLARVKTSQVTVADAERQAMALVLEHCGFGHGILAGNSIHQDRRFLTKYMPSFERCLHYRQVDVSSLKILAKAWYPDRLHFPKTEKSHTALDDVRASLAELSHYRHSLFREPSSPT